MLFTGYGPHGVSFRRINSIEVLKNLHVSAHYKLPSFEFKREVMEASDV